MSELSTTDDHELLNSERKFQERKARSTVAETSAPAVHPVQRKPRQPKVEGERQDTKAEQLIKIGQKAELWRDQDARSCATWSSHGHNESGPIMGTAFKAWLSGRFFEETEKGASNDNLKDAICTLSAIAANRGEQYRSALRLAPHADGIILDMGDDHWRMIEVSPDGWQVVQTLTDTRFIRRPGMRPLPIPQSGGDISDLWKFINVSEPDRLLILGWLLQTLMPTGAYFGLSLFGGQGTAKSSATRVLRNLIDPNQASTASFPRDAQGLFIGATAQHCPCFDNLSYLSGEQSDWLCRLSTGDSYRARTLYSDSDETILSARRPWIINGIPNLVSRGDLLERAIGVELLPLSESDRLTEKELDAKFAEVAPGILGCLLDAVSASLANGDRIGSSYKGRLPRMADAASWITAGERSLGYAEGSFLKRHNSMISSSGLDAIDADPIAGAIVLLCDGDSLETTVGELLKTIRDNLEWKEGRKPHDPLETIQKFTSHLTRISNLVERSAGLRIEKLDRHRSLGRRLRIGPPALPKNHVTRVPHVTEPGKPVTRL